MMIKKMMRTIAVILALMMLSGCMGHGALTSKVVRWNLETVDSRWGREGVFLGLWITLVYPVCFILDLLIFNSIEFWSGENPITDQPALVNIPKETLEKIFGEKEIDMTQIQRINDTEAKLYLAFADGDKMTFDVVRSNDTYSVSYLGRQFFKGQINETILSKEGV